MGIDLSPAAFQSDFHGTLRSWVKCAKCSEALSRPYPVESMGIDGAESSTLADGRYKLVVKVGCHGEQMRCAIEIPVSWPPNLRFQALAYVWAFVRRGDGVYTCDVRRGARDPGPLRTKVN